MELIGAAAGRVIMDLLKLDSGKDTTQRVDSIGGGGGGEHTAVAVTASARWLHRSRG